jgi:hypothetical protein
MKTKNGFRDLGLNYMEAAHGIQSAVRFEMSQKDHPDGGPTVDMLKNTRVGVDMRAAEQWGLVSLLIEKGVFTLDEYKERMRLAINEELARYEEHHRKEYGLSQTMGFR